MQNKNMQINPAWMYIYEEIEEFGISQFIGESETAIICGTPEIACRVAGILEKRKTKYSRGAINYRYRRRKRTTVC